MYFEMEIGDRNMEQMSPIRHSDAMLHVTPECTSRLSRTGGEDSGYDSFPSTKFSSSLKEGSVSPDDVRKRLFDLSKSSFTPGVSSITRSNRATDRKFRGRCILSVSHEEELEDEVNTPDSQNVRPEFSTPAISRPALPPKSTSSPIKPHPYYARDISGNLRKSSKITVIQNRRTPPRKNRSTTPIIRFPSFDDLNSYRDPFRPRDGVKCLDFLRCLGKERLMAPALSLVLSYLSGEDLIACCLVSKTWQTLVMDDRKANSRRLLAVKRKEWKKENPTKASLKGRIDVNSGSRHVLRLIQNANLMLPPNEILKTPPPKLSPRKLRFELFMKEGLRLEGKEDQHLSPCPRCSLPSRVDSHLNVGVCTRIGCQFRFCTLCHCLEHVLPVNSTSSSSPPRYITCPFAETPKTPPSPPQPIATSTRSRITSVGGKRSKRNLRRLL